MSVWFCMRCGESVEAPSRGDVASVLEAHRCVWPLTRLKHLRLGGGRAA